MTDRCDLSDLIVDQCVHCTNNTRNLGPAWLDLIDEPLEENGD